MTQLTLPIVIGKQYVRRDGVVITARENHKDIIDFTVFVGEGEVSTDEKLHVYRDTGRVWNSEDETCEYDLVADYEEPAEKIRDHAPAQDHPHAALMLEYARDWAKTPSPWERWEYLEGGTGEWLDIIGDHPSWDRDNAYRRKPRVVNINGHKMPEPLRVAPAYGTVYWMPSLGHSEHADNYVWLNDESDKRFLLRGLVHMTKEAAAAYAQALLSFTTSV